MGLFSKKAPAQRPASRTVYVESAEDEKNVVEYLSEWRKTHRVNSWNDQEKAVREAMDKYGIDDKYFESIFTFASGFLNTPFYFKYETAVHQDGQVYKRGGNISKEGGLISLLMQRTSLRDFFN